MNRTSDHKCRDCRMMAQLPPKPRPICAWDTQRCVTHARAFRKARREKAAVAQRTRRFGLTAGQQETLWKIQGGRCAGCGRVPGPNARRPAVDHQHGKCGPEKHPQHLGCIDCVRGLLCYSCNSDILPAVRDDPTKLRRLADYLEHPPGDDLRARNAPDS